MFKLNPELKWFNCVLICNFLVHISDPRVISTLIQRIKLLRHSWYIFLLLCWFFSRVFSNSTPLKRQVFTMPEYLGRRFGGQRMRIYLSLIALVLYVATKISVSYLFIRASLKTCIRTYGIITLPCTSHVLTIKVTYNVDQLK